MGGCALIGQSMINVNSGGTGRLSGIVASLFLLSFILVGSSWIEQIPLAALIGVMFVVCEKTFEWGTFRLFGKVPRADALVIVLVAGITLAFDLAVAVLAGVIVSALVFAWQHAKQIRVATSVDARGWKVYELEGTLFFASVSGFQALFAPKEDPQDVVIEFLRARVADHSAIQAIDALAERYRLLGKRLHLRHLSPDCRELLEKAKDMIEVNLPEDPRYHVADDKLG
jgi:SulP family sulfate permease